LFGGNPAATSAPTTSLFGSAPTQPAQSGSLFGASTPATSAPASGGLFGNAPTSAPASGGLFGGSTAASSAPASGGLFGASAAAKPAASTGGLFGNTQAAPTGNTGSLFGGGATQTTSNNTLFGGSNAGKPATTGGNNTTVPGVKIDLANLRGTTRFGDLHEDLQRLVETIDKQIVQEMEYNRQMEAFLPGHESQLEYIPNDVEFVGKKYDAAMSALNSDAQAIDAGLKQNKADAEDAKRCFLAIDRLKLPQQYHASLWERSSVSDTRSADLAEYFSRVIDSMKKTLDTYNGSISEIESHLATVEQRALVGLRQRGYDNGNGKLDAEDSLKELIGVLRGFEEGILKVAGKVGETREGVQELNLVEYRR
jgi:nucleoporin p58/p45